MHESIKTRVLFVDDEASILNMLRWMMKRMEPDFEAVFAESGPEALAQMDQGSFDILISDMRMPGMNGAELLNETMRRSPRTVRVILSGYADEDLAMRCVASTHQWLAKPCSTLVLMDLLNRVRSLQAWLRQRELQSVAAGLTHLPSLPAIYLRLSELLASPVCSIQQVGALVSEDPPLAAKLLQLANSAAFGFHGTVTSPAEAVQMLGGQRVRSLALVQHLFSAFQKGACARLPLEDIWNHSVRTAFLARQIALAERQHDQFVEQSFSGGLLHDIGQLTLATSMGDAYAALWRRAASTSSALHLIERQELQSSHAEAGAYLLGIWGLPLPLVEAVAWHHEPGRNPTRSFCPLTTVHVASFLANESRGARAGVWGNVPEPLDTNYLNELGLADRLPVWRDLLDPA